MNFRRVRRSTAEQLCGDLTVHCALKLSVLRLQLLHSREPTVVWYQENSLTELRKLQVFQSRAVLTCHPVFVVFKSQIAMHNELVWVEQVCHDRPAFYFCRWYDLTSWPELEPQLRPQLARVNSRVAMQTAVGRECQSFQLLPLTTCCNSCMQLSNTECWREARCISAAYIRACSRVSASETYATSCGNGTMMLCIALKFRRACTTIVRQNQVNTKLQSVDWSMLHNTQRPSQQLAAWAISSSTR